ncbi:MAG: hypothetical protein H6981_08320 [Gammaproteobacteria bacterium]|nr:hypothetical protein [Gammaproteobacteria bacterium]MCP5136791.1 hypothetical protein [Gammaproteobacteria bacterium]
MAEIVAFKARNAGNSRSIAKFRNAESGNFRLQMSVNDSIRGSLGNATPTPMIFRKRRAVLTRTAPDGDGSA